MIYLGIAIGTIVGAGGYYLYDKYWGTVEARLAKLKAKAAALKAKL